MNTPTYRPEHPVYEIPESYEAYPRTLNFGGETAEEAAQKLTEQLIAEPTKETVVRRLDEVEIETLRKDYTFLMENDKPAVESRLSNLAAEEAALKDRIKNEKEVLSALLGQINDKVKLIKGGVADEPLDANRSVRIALDGNYLYYTYTGSGNYTLAKVEPIPQGEEGSLFNLSTKNQEVFIRLFGCCFTPSDRFEEVKVTKKGMKALIGRQLAAAAVVHSTEDFLDNDTGEVVSIERSREIVARDVTLDDVTVRRLIDAEVPSVVLYKLPESTPSDGPVEA